MISTDNIPRAVVLVLLYRGGAFFAEQISYNTPMSETEKKTWDLPTRFLHWLIAGSLITSLTLALLAEGLEDILGKKWETLFLVGHFYVGLLAIGLVITSNHLGIFR